MDDLNSKKKSKKRKKRAANLSGESVSMIRVSSYSGQPEIPRKPNNNITNSPVSPTSDNSMDPRLTLNSSVPNNGQQVIPNQSTPTTLTTIPTVQNQSFPTCIYLKDHKSSTLATSHQLLVLVPMLMGKYEYV